jgi:hypothetical protein
MPRKKTPTHSGPYLFPVEEPPNGHANGVRRVVAAERLPTNTTTHQHPIHRWFNFIAGFSPEFVHDCCDAVAGQEAPVTFLDPFAGCATGPLVACQRGMRAIGYEPHPFFCRVARAKLPGVGALAELDRIERVLTPGFLHPKPLSLLPAAPAAFLRKLFPEHSLQALLGAREALRSSDLRDSDLAFLVLSRVLDKSSHSQTDGIYKAPTSRREPTSPLTAFQETVRLIRSDLLTAGCHDSSPLAVVHQASSQDMQAVASDSVSLIVTSPPYLNNFDFAEMTRMYLYFWGMATTWGEITDRVRSKLIVNTTTALKGHKDRQEEYRAKVPPRLRPDLDSLVKELAARRVTKAGKKEYDLLVYPYFSQMTAVLRECWRCLRQGARIHLMVADAALYGVHVSTPQLLCETLREVGFREASCAFVRKRGHRWVLSKREGSKQGLGEYHVSALK